MIRIHLGVFALSHSGRSERSSGSHMVDSRAGGFFAAFSMTILGGKPAIA
jgi:hypothetical protein